MKNPWGLEGKNPWKKDKKEPSLEKKSNPWGLTGKKPWNKEETDKERIARLEKEVEELKGNQKKHDDSWIDEQGFVPKPKKKKSGMGCMTIIGIILLIGYLATFFDSDEKSTKTNTKTTTQVEFKDDAENRDRKNKLTKRFKDGDIIAPAWSPDGRTFTIYMKNPNTTVAFATAVCQIARDDYYIKYEFNIQIGKLPSYKNVGSAYLCPRKVGF